MIISENSGASYPTIPEGLYTAACYQVIDLGVHINETFGTRSRKVLFTWEIPELQIEVENKDTGEKEQKPRVISREFSAVLSDKSHIKPFLTQWRGKAFTPEELLAFDIGKILKAPCQLQVIHTNKNGKTFANVSACLPAPKGYKHTFVNEPILFDLLPENIDDIKKLPEWIQNKIKKSETYQEIIQQEAGVTSEELMDEMIGGEEIPF